MELKNSFELSAFDRLSEEKTDFLMAFLRNRGNLKSLQSELQISYPLAKKKLDEWRCCTAGALGAKPDETWLHAKDMPGSHVIICREGEIPLTTMKQAALLAAWYSKGQRSSLVPVDYTLRRYVKKPSGAAPGKVIYTHQKTAYMTPEEEEIKGIRLLEA